jgi:Matrixin
MIRRLFGIAILGVLLCISAGVDLPGPLARVQSFVSTEFNQAHDWLQTRAWDGASAKHAGSFAFLATNADGSPARFNPCQMIPVVANPTGAPAGAIEDLRAALSEINAATGLRLELVGRSNAIPTSAWGNRAAANGTFPPVLVAWAHLGQSDLVVAGDYALAAPGAMMMVSGRKVLVSGKVVVRTDGTRLHSGFGAGVSDGRILLHEFGHVVGLAHTSDRSQVMSISASVTGRFGAGDLAGLKRVSEGGCIPGSPAMRHHV